MDEKLRQEVKQLKQEAIKLNNQLDFFRRRVEVLERKCNISPENISNVTRPMSTEVTPDSLSESIPRQNLNSQRVQISIEPKASQYTSTEDNSATKNKKDMEELFGKSIMGIVASILIFVSLILFAKVIYPLFNDAVRIFAMYAISFTFLIVGLLRLKKRNNVFNKSLAGCGLGAIYISLLMSNIHFEVIGDIVLYLLILVWALFANYLARLKGNVFHIIGECGIAIGVLVGMIPVMRRRI